MAVLANRAKMTTSTTGTGTITLGSASTGFQTFDNAGITNGQSVQYVIEDGVNFEIGTGTYTSSGTTLTRGAVTESNNSDNAINLSGAAVVFIAAIKIQFDEKLNLTGGALTGALTTNSTIDGRDVAADGVLAANALPKGGGAMTGAITTNSTFDGRDVAADGVLATNALPKAGGTMTGDILLATNKKLVFRDSAISISSTDDGDLSIAADDEIDITSTLLDVNGNLDVSGTALITGVVTASAGVAVSGNITVSGTVDGVDLQTLNTAVSANTAKTGITSGQANAISANTSKTGITSGQANAISANTSKTTNATHSGEVTGSGALTIAGNVVDEANLKVSNGPTNGYALTAQSGNTGGLTWAAVGASTTYLAVGTYVLAQYSQGSQLTPGTTQSGQNLFSATCYGNTYARVAVGTWRLMGFSLSYAYGGTASYTSVWARIS